MTVASTDHGTTLPPAPTPLPRTALVWLAGSVLLAVLVTICLSAVAVTLRDWWGGLVPHTVSALADLSPLRSPSTPTSAAVLLLTGTAGTIACLRLWWILSTTCACAARGRTLRHDSRTRRVVLAACGVALTVGAVSPAHAGGLSSLDGLPLPERPVSSQATEPSTGPAPTPTPSVAARPTVSPTAVPPHAATAVAAPDATPARKTRTSTASVTVSPPTAGTHAPADTIHTHVVAPGDTLWQIAQQSTSTARSTTTPASSTAATVAALHHTNADVIGADPNLLLPGQVLTIPDPTDSPSSQPTTHPTESPAASPTAMHTLDNTSTEENR